jgi:ssDNA-binding Zn-finger/Zn-ribbon topoisomerase 1
MTSHLGEAMPDEPKPFPPKQLNMELAAQKFKEFWGTVTCPICATIKWHFGPNLVHLFHVDELVKPSAEVYPCVVVSCDKCGYTILFNAAKLGLDNG